MHPIYRQVFFVILSLISLAVTCNKCQKMEARNARQAWNPELEKQMYDVFYLQSANLSDDEKARKEYADCCLSKTKELFPKGISSSGAELNDSLKTSILKMGVECANILAKRINVWESAPEVKKQLSLQFYSLKETKMLPPKMREEYVDCITFKVTTEFPHGLEGSNKKTLQDFIEKSRHECLVLITNKYQKAAGIKMRSQP